jgi:cell division inhibitor SulA
MDRASKINSLLGDTPGLWRGREPNRRQQALPTGHCRLDACLPGGGWPVGAVTELIAGQPGLGEFSLLFPALSHISHNGKWLILIDPPWIPYPAALHGRGLVLERLLLVRTGNARESLWACEQALRGSQYAAVLAWPAQASFACLRRLQLAAEAGANLAFLFCPEPALTTASPAALRLYLQGDGCGTRIDVLKCRGRRPGEPIRIPYLHANKLPCSAGMPQELPDGAHAIPATSGKCISLPASFPVN